jgi:hypothetical protein
MGGGGIAPQIFNLSTKQKCVVSIISWSFNGRRPVVPVEYTGCSKVSVNLMITVQKLTTNVQSVPHQSPDIY